MHVMYVSCMMDRLFLYYLVCIVHLHTSFKILLRKLYGFPNHHLVCPKVAPEVSQPYFDTWNLQVVKGDANGNV